MSTQGDLGRRDYLILKLAVRKGWLEPNDLREALQPGPGTSIMGLLLKGESLSSSRVEKLSKAISRQMAKEEPTVVFKRKDSLFRRFLIEYQECPLGAISAAMSEQKRGNGWLSIGEILVRKGMLAEDRLQQLRRLVDDYFYRQQATLLCGSQDERQPETPDLTDFEVLEEIGRGGMGLIYKARQKGLDRIVALKVLDSLRSNETKVKRFKRETKALSALRHPNIVSILQVGEESGIHFFSMELVEGNTLEQAFERGEQPLSERLELVLQVCQGIGYAHQKGILHRDIKPANIILDEHSVPKIADFGLSRDMREDTLLTRDGTILGTPFYMAPEQIQGNRNEIGPHTDQFALGVLIYEATTGELPFHGSSSVEIYNKILHDEPVPLERMAEDAPEGLGLIQRKALSKSPANRYGSVLDLADDLDALLKGEAISIRPPGLTQRAFCQLQCHKVKLIAGALASLCLLTGAIWWRNLSGQTPPPSPPPPAGPKPPKIIKPDDPAVRRAALREKLEELRTQLDHALAARQYKKVLELAAQMRKLAPQSDESHMYEAQALWRMSNRSKPERLKKVIATTQKVLSLNKKRILAYALQGRAHREMRNFKQAYQVLTAGLLVAPRDPECLLLRALTLNTLNRNAESLADLSQLVEVEPENANARFYRGLVYRQMGMTSKAIDDLSIYLRKQPTYAPAWYFRATCYEQEEKLKLAMEDYIRGLEAGLPRRDAAKARARLKVLRKRLGNR